MATPPLLNAQTLVGLLSRMTNMDMQAAAQVAGVPKKNLMAWFAGKRQALRLRSIVAILHTVGIRIESLRTVLDPERVHFWTIRLPRVGTGREALATLTAVSKLMPQGVITEVRPSPKHWQLHQRLFRRYFMISSRDAVGGRFQVVVCLRTHPLRKARVTPEVIKGAVWRDDNEHHCLTVPQTAWHAVTARDMTVEEFARIFEGVVDKFNWGDVGLMAREFGLTAEDVAEWMIKAANESETSDTPTEAVNIRFLLAPMADAA